MKFILSISGITAFLITAFVGLFWIMKQANKFYRKCDEIEVMIRGEATKEEVIKSIYAIRNDSFCRQTGERLRELALMAEIKYQVVIIRK